MINNNEWDGLDAMLKAQPLDLNGVRDSEYFGRVSFYMSPPREDPVKKMQNVPSISKMQDKKDEKENKGNELISPVPQPSLSNGSAQPITVPTQQNGIKPPSRLSAPKPVAKRASTASSETRIPFKERLAPKVLKDLSKTQNQASVQMPPPSLTPTSSLCTPKPKTPAIVQGVKTTPTPVIDPLHFTAVVPSTSSSSTPYVPHPAESSSAKKSPHLHIASAVHALSSPNPIESDASTPNQETSKAFSDLQGRVFQLEEDNRFLKKLVESSHVQNAALTQKVHQLESQLTKFMLEVQMVLLNDHNVNPGNA